MQEELAARVVVDAAMKVHSALGPGLLESAYQTCLEYELFRRDVRIRKQVALPVCYADVVLDVGIYEMASSDWLMGSKIFASARCTLTVDYAI
jgi:GxxExxY protein